MRRAPTPALHGHVMRLELTGRHLRITPSLRQLVEEGIEKLHRMLNDSAVSLQAVLSQQKHRHRVEMTLHARGDHFFHGAGSGKDWETAINGAVDKVEQQARKLKGKWTEGRRRRSSPAVKAAAAAPRPERGGRAPGEDGQERGVRIIRARRTAAKPMSVDEAALEVGDHAGEFIVFRNANTDAVNVLFRRPDGNLGLIEPEA
jgi:putative sigma-54 modulation protein